MSHKTGMVRPRYTAIDELYKNKLFEAKAATLDKTE